MNPSSLSPGSIVFMRPSNYEMVRQFHEAFGHPSADAPELPGGSLANLRMNLLIEEVKELIDALEDNDLEEIAKELADILYVTYGFFAAIGVDADLAFEEVHRSNMSKLGKDGSPAYRDDGKVLKGPDFIPADMKKVVRESGGE